MKKYISFVVGIMCAVLLIPAMASADAVADLQSQIQALLGQVKTLQMQLMVAEHASSTSGSGIMWMGTTTPAGGDNGHMMGMMGGDQGNHPDMRKFCVSVSRNIGIGSRGDDVKGIQAMLASDPTLYTGTTTGYFGLETAHAMARFQSKFGIASSTTGFIGSITRQFFAQQCPPLGMNQSMMNDDHMMMSTSTRPFPPMHGDMMMGTSSTQHMPSPPMGMMGHGGDTK